MRGIGENITVQETLHDLSSGFLKKGELMAVLKVWQV